MLNTSLLNTLRLNTQQLRDGGYDELTNLTDSVKFGALELNTGGIVISRLVHDSMPEREFRTFDIPRENGGGINGDYWRTKRIIMDGYITKTTNAELESAIDNMKQVLSQQAGNLDINVAGTVRRYTATLVNAGNMFSDRKHYHISFCPFRLEFDCLTPFGESVNYQVDSFEETSLEYSNEIVNSGTAKAKGVVVLNFSAADTVTVVKWENTRTGEAIQITSSFSAGDILEINAREKTVTLNDVAVDYDGVFPHFVVGINYFTITITGTSAAYALTVKHKRAFF
jgi:hypothetical protein